MSTDRDSVTGRWLKGNQASVGNRGGGFGIRAGGAAWIRIMREQTSDEDVIAITQKAVKQAIAGDEAARRFLFDYVCGKPVQRVEEPNTDLVALLRVWRSPVNTDVDEAHEADSG